jgi:pilus assembly protein CpaF
MKELVQKAGLLRGDTIVINEVGGTEAFDVINLMREGFSVLATVMAEGVHDCLRKFELLCMMDQSNLGSKEITYHVATGVDAVIFQERLAGGKRVMSHIALVEGLDDLERFITVPLFTYDEQTGEFFLTPKGKAFLEQ